MPNPLKIFSISKKQSTIPFKEYYTNWFHTLKNPLLPLLHQTLSSPSSQALLSSHLNLLLHHFLSYYDSLDLAVTTDPNNLPYLLFPSWRNSLEKPFLFLGDLHPYTFTNLIRSFLDQENHSDDENDLVLDNYNEKKSLVVLDRPWQVMMAWKNTSKKLINKIEQIECGLRLIVPSLMDRYKRAQAGFVARVADDWVGFGGKKEKFDVGEAMKMETEELVSVFVDANRLRRSVISEIVGALNVYQGALFLEGLAQFLVGFKEPGLIREFEKCKIPINDRAGN
ncbi:protein INAPERTURATE POLLEN1 [Mercurialis annua]|uniref:protein INAPERTURATE POLLEN1 n=1 Tax=Mercurialis annua TaxID=3986 RepID=UPI00215FA09C|nr:protein INAPERTURATE POLLEN1 [Mercurialis annua]